MARPALRIAILTAALAAALPGAAWAQDPAPPAAPPPPAARRAGRGSRSSACARGRCCRATRCACASSCGPTSASRQVAVRILRGGRRRAELKAPVLPGPGGRGVATVTYRPTRAGRLAVRAVHAATPFQAAFRAGPRHVTVRVLEARPGDRGRPVRILQRALRRRHYVVGRRGSYDDRTARAVTAFRKVVGLARTDVATPDVFRRLARGPGRLPRPLPAARPARRGRPLPAGPGARARAPRASGSTRRRRARPARRPSWGTSAST